MARVFTQEQLAAAIQASDPDIQIAADFNISTQLNISYVATISGAGGSRYTLTKANSYDGVLFQVQDGGSLTLQNIILDGALEAHSSVGSSLVQVSYGTLVLDTGAVLQNNRAGEGGGLCLDAAASGTLDLSNAQSMENTAQNSGCGCTIRSASPSDPLTLTMKEAGFSSKQGVYRGGELYSAEGTGRITIRGGSQITENRAASGGGIYHTSERVLALEGATISQNTAAAGQGAYNAGPLELGAMTAIPDRLYLPNQDAVPTIVAHLSSGSVVQLERSDYVTPNPAVAPIVVARSDLELTEADEAAFRIPPSGFAGWWFRLSEDRHQVLLTPAEYALRYENTLGAENPNPASYTVFTSTITLLPLGNTPGSRFLGWYDAAEGGNRVTQIPQGSTGDTNLYAQWDAIEYTVTYYGNDSGGPAAENVPPPQQVQGGTSAVLSDQFPTRTGYAFIGWNTDPDGSGTAYQPGGAIPSVLSNANLYAQWRYVDYTLTYHGNDEGGPPAQNIPNRQVFHVEQVFPLSDMVPIREGYRFTGWNTAPDGSGTAYQPGASFGPAIADADLYAQWEAVPPTLYLLTYEPNDAGGPSAQDIPEQREIPEGETAELSAAIPTRTGYRFLGWNSAPDGSGTAYQPGQTAGPFYADLTLYAQWQQMEYTLAYHGNDAGGPPAQNVPGPQPIYEGQSVPLSDAVPTRDGFRFTGWNTQPDGSGTPYQPGASFGPATANADFYAQWEVVPPTLYLLTYEPNDAGGPLAQDIPEQREIPEGGIMELSAAVPTRTGYRFLGWNTAPDGSGTAYQPGQTAGPFYADLTLYAQWQQMEYTLTYHGNDAGGPPAQNVPGPQMITEGQVISVPGMIPTREGFRFTGWNTAPDRSGNPYQPGSTIGPISSDIDLYAQWIPLSPVCCTLAYYGNDAGGPPACCIPCPQRIPAGQCVRISCYFPRRIGYCFAGWNTSPCGTGQMVWPGQTIGPVTGNICLSAQWKRTIPCVPPKPCRICRF